MLAVKKMLKTNNMSTVLYSLRKEDKTIYEIAEDTGINSSVVQDTINRLVTQYDSIEKKGFHVGSRKGGRKRIIWGTTDTHKILNRVIVQ